MVVSSNERTSETVLDNETNNANFNINSVLNKYYFIKHSKLRLKRKYCSAEIDCVQRERILDRIKGGKETGYRGMGYFLHVRDRAVWFSLLRVSRVHIFKAMRM